MNDAAWQRVKDLFHAALECGPSERPTVLAKCSEEERREVEALLSAHDEAGSGRSRGLELGGATGAAMESAGSTIGRYKLIEQIGEGGFGIVYRAEQSEPIRRTVALKVIKLGMDTKQVIARFEAERQALALMDHPHIAKVLDGGATDAGRPYFVMELVKGIPITDYADHARLDTAERLELFRDVCHAVQHAHQKGVIHRDIKPSNVLVTEVAGAPVPKVIDFGIAKATNHRLTEKTVFTASRQMVGTPDYMSPEQARANGLDVDTRTDIYSLGVLLYELLTGSKPFTCEELLRVGYESLLRHIREVDPPKPSTRISTLGEDLPKAARQRRIPPKNFSKLLRGDLDWIVMKAIEKERDRRYGSPADLAADIERHLTHKPVHAGPPSAGYRAGKFVRRNRTAVGATVAVTVAIGLGAVLAMQGFQEASRESSLAREAEGKADRREREADAARAAEAEQRRLADARVDLEYAQLCAQAGDALAREGERRFGRSAPESPAALMTTAVELRPERFDAYLFRALDGARSGDEQIADLEAARAYGLSAATYHWAMAYIHGGARRGDEMERHRQAALAEERAAPETGFFRARLLRATGDSAGALSGLDVALAELPDDHPLAPPARGLRAQLRSGERDYVGALTDRLALRGAENDVANTASIAALLRLMGNAEEAQVEFERSVEAVRRLGSEAAWSDLGNTYLNLEMDDWVVDVCDESHALFPESPRFMLGKAMSLRGMPRVPGSMEAALGAAQKSVQIDPEYAAGHHMCATILIRLQRFPEALDAFDRAVECGAQADGEMSIERAMAYASLGDQEDAVAHLQQAEKDSGRSVYMMVAIGDVYMRLGRVDDALAVAQRAAAERPNHGEAHALLGAAYIKKKQFEDARSAFLAAQRCGRDTVFVRAQLAEAWLGLRSYRQAAAEVKRALEMAGDDPATLVLQARILNGMKKLPDALDSVDLALKIGGPEGLPLLWKGIILLEMGEPERAESALRECMTYGGGHKPHEYLGRALRAQGRLDDARDELEIATEMDPTCEQSCFFLGLVEHVRGDVDKALAAFERAHALDPEDSGPPVNAAIAYYSQGDWTAARAMIEKALDLNYQSSGSHLIHADVLMEISGEEEAALEAYRRGISLDQSSAQCHARYVGALRILDRAKEAVAAAERARAAVEGPHVAIDALLAAARIDVGALADAYSGLEHVVESIRLSDREDVRAIAAKSIARGCLLARETGQFERLLEYAKLRRRLEDAEIDYVILEALASAHLGNARDARAALTEAMQLVGDDGARIATDVIHALLLLGDIAQADEISADAVEFDAPAFVADRVRVLRAAGRIEEARALASSQQDAGGELGDAPRQAYVLSVAGRAERARELLGTAPPESARDRIRHARVHSALGDAEEALRLVRRAREDGYPAPPDAAVLPDLPSAE